jgi:2-oxoglutarate/2-oxoacid ferredoxin oxidoreductase subunit alpha
LLDHIVVFELNTGQMVEDVRLAVEGRSEVSFYGRPGGGVPTPDEIAKGLSSTCHRISSRKGTACGADSGPIKALG